MRDHSGKVNGDERGGGSTLGWTMARFPYISYQTNRVVPLLGVCESLGENIRRHELGLLLLKVKDR